MSVNWNRISVSVPSMHQVNPVVEKHSRAGPAQREIVSAIDRLLLPDGTAKRMMYDGRPVVGGLLTAIPIRFGALLSLAGIVFLLLPALLINVAMITDTMPTTADAKWPWIGFWQRWNWSVMYVVIFPVIFSGVAWLSRECVTVFNSLTKSNFADVKPMVTKQDESPATDFLDSISTDMNKSYGWVFYAVLVLTAILTAADVGLIAHGYYEHLWSHVPFEFPDSDWSVAFQLSPSRFHFLGKTPPGPWLNLGFDVLAYSAQTLSIFCGFFWIIKYWALLNIFSKRLINGNITFTFNPWWSDPKHRMGLHKVGKLFNGFLFVTVLFQTYVFGHRLQLILRGGHSLSEYVSQIKAAPKDFHVLWNHAYFATCTPGMWLLLTFVLLPVVVISWVPLLRFRKYLKGVIDQHYESLRGDLQRFPDGSPQRAAVLREWKEVNDTNIWPNGDYLGWLFLALMVCLTIAAWFPPAALYAVYGGGGAFIVKFLNDLRPKPKAE
jgi:hypothetical protein